MSELPTIHTSRYFALEELVQKRPEAIQKIVPVQISLRPCIAPLSYEIEEIAHCLQMNESEGHQDLEWPALSPEFWRYLDGLAFERVAGELSEISVRHEGKPLVLTCYENIIFGDCCQRRIFASWWQKQTGEEVLEIDEYGEAWREEDLHRQRKVRRPR